MHGDRAIVEGPPTQQQQEDTATTIGVERLTEMTRNARSTEAQLVLKDLDLREVDFAVIERTAMSLKTD